MDESELARIEKSATNVPAWLNTNPKDMLALVTECRRLAADNAALRAAAEAATPGPWDWAGTAFETLDEAKAWLGRMLDFAPDNLFLHGVGHMLDGSHMPDEIDDPWAFVMPAITGNGPTAEANAKYLRAANPSAVLALLDENERLWLRVANAETAHDWELIRADRDRLAADNAALRAAVRAWLESKNDLEVFYQMRTIDDDEHTRLSEARWAAEEAVWALFPDLEQVNG